MFRNAILAFIAGWALWFWIDKSPYSLGPLPPTEDGDYLDNFQAAFNLVRSGRPGAAWVFIWKAHFLILSLGFGLLFSMLFESLMSAWRRKRMFSMYLPGKKPRKNDHDSGQQDPPARS